MGRSVVLRARQRSWVIVAVTLIVVGLSAIPAVAKSRTPLKSWSPNKSTIAPRSVPRGHRPPNAMIKYYMAHYAVSQPVAVSRLELQGKAGDIVGQMRHALGSHYGNVWFDNATGRYKVGVVGGAALGASALPYLESQGIADQTDLVDVRSSASDLEEEQERINAKLAPQFSQSAVATGINSEDNSITVRLASNLPEPEVVAVQAAAKTDSVNVEIVPENPEKLAAKPMGCANHTWETVPMMFCDRSLRGGDTIVDLGHPGGFDIFCSLGFIAHNSSGEYVMMAGHCDKNESKPEWASGFSSWSESNPIGDLNYIGGEDGNYVGGEGDFGWIKVSTSKSPWYPISDPSDVASLNPSGPWGENENNFLENIAWSAQGDTNCRTGGSSDTQCGEVLATNETVNAAGYGNIGRLTRDSFCAISGDSGGTVWGNHSGMGMLDLATSTCYHSGAESWYTEAIRDSYLMGLSYYVPPYGETY